MDPNYNDGLDFTDPDVPSWGAVWDQSNDLALSGETGTVNFNFL